MIRRVSKVLLEIIAVVITSWAILFVGAAVLLSRGPVSVGFVVPYIAKALESESRGFQVSLDDAVLTWGGWQHSVQLRAVAVKVTDQAGNTHADIPELTIGFSIRALLHAQLAPTTLEVVGTRLSLVRGEDGAIQFAQAPSPAVAPPESPAPVSGEAAPPSDVSGDLVSDMFADILAPEGPDNKLGYLTSLRIYDADITLVDRKLDMTWRAPAASLLLLKSKTGLRLSGSIGLDIGGEAAEFALSGDYNTKDELISAELHLADVQPALFVASAPLFEPLAGLKLPLNGVIRLRAKFDGEVQLFAFDMKGGEGSILLPGAASAEAVPVRSVLLRGGLSDDLKAAQIDDFQIDLGGPILSATASVQGVNQGVVDGPFELAADLELHDLTIADLKRLWPEGVAKNARDWVVENITEGLIPDGKVTLSGAAGDEGIDSFEIGDLSGGFRYSGMVTTYFDTMPAVRRGSGTATISKRGLSFAVTGGSLQRLQIGPSKVDITGFDEADQWLTLEVVVNGAVTDILTLLDHPRLGYIKGMGMKPADVGGVTAVRLALRFPLIAALTFKEVEIAAAAALRDVTVSKAAFDLDLSQGDVTLQLDGRGMDVTGRAVLGAIPIGLTWSENFTPQGFSRRFNVQATMTDADRRSIGLDLDEYLQGPVGVVAVLTQYPSKANDLALTADVGAAALDIAPLGWRKETGIAGTVRANLALSGDKPTLIRDFTLQGDGYMSQGSATFAADGKTVNGAKLNPLRYGRSDIAADISRRGDGGFDIAITGKAFDAAHVFKSDNGEAGKTLNGAAADAAVTPLSIALDVETLHLNDEGSLANVTARLQRDSKHWRTIKLEAEPAPAKTFTVDLAPNGANRRLQVRSDDAGSIFKALGISENVIGGRLRLDGDYDDSQASGPLSGKLEAENFRLVRAPVMAKLLSVALLTGVLDSLRGEGIGFDRLDMPFTLKDGVIEMRSARAHGSALGVTAEGWINLDRETIGLRGTIVPAYAVNSILNNIPLIGPLLGGEGSGIFAATYRMTGRYDDPETSVNPLASLTPGFLRGLFRVFEGGVPPQEPPLPDPSQEREAPLPKPSGARN